MKRNFWIEVARGLVTNMMLIGIILVCIGVDMWVYRFHI